MLKKFLSAALLTTIPFSIAMAIEPLKVTVIAGNNVVINNYELDVDNCFARPFAVDCINSNASHHHHFYPLLTRHISFNVPRNEYKLGTQLISYIGFRHPYNQRPLICKPYDKASIHQYQHIDHATVYIYKPNGNAFCLIKD